MESRQDMPNPGQEDQGNSEMGEEAPAGMDSEESNNVEGAKETQHDPLYVQKRLKQQKRVHDREIRELHSRMNEMQRGGGQPQQQSAMGDPNANEPQGYGIDEQIHKAVSYALQHKEMEERKAEGQRQAHHVQKQYQELHKHLDKVADKYDDFDEVVMGEDAPFSRHMQDAALFLPKTGAGSAGEVLYKLGKNQDELKRIARLEPVDQASEMVKLSHALISGGEGKHASSPKTLGAIKSNPVTNSLGITDKTPIGSIRERMKSGKFK